ncbi:MAG: cell division protein ZipA [Methylococcus sp.]|nr:MAG: cell division protein ZipA [Methylococcus sp.]
MDMDRDTVRLLLIVAGVIVLAGIYLWSRLRESGKPDPNLGDYGDFEESEEYDGGDYFEEEVRVITPGSRKEPQLSGLDFEERDDFELEAVAPSTQTGKTKTTNIDRSGDTPAGAEGGAPFLIQISVVAGPGRFFHGPDLKQALLDVDLLFGDMGIFHRYDSELTQTQFSVASLIEPGTFPIDEMDGFECPGIVLFFQTARVSDPLSIYDDLVNTSRELAQRLHGIQWDETRQPLSAGKITHMRNLLRQAPEATAS